MFSLNNYLEAIINGCMERQMKTFSHYLESASNEIPIIKCPKCGSNDVHQYRQRTGPIWCSVCKYRVEKKEDGNPFYTPDRSKNDKTLAQ